MAERNSNLRKLAAAYAQGKLDKLQYRKLRMAQLSALDFDKPVPNLPSDLANIRVPKQGEAPNAPAKSSSNNKIIIIAVITILICIATYFIVTM